MVHPLQLTALRDLEGALIKGKETLIPLKRFRKKGHIQQV